MLDKINAEIAKLNADKVALTNPAEFDKLVAEKVAEFKENLIISLNEKKEEDIKEIDFKLNCLENWKAELEQAALAEQEQQEQVVDQLPLN